MRHTALIVEPRRMKNVDRLIMDTHRKLGHEWKIVFYCGQGLKPYWEPTCPGIEIRELTTNNLSPDEYSNFLKTKQLWESLTGEYVLVFQADTFIVNEPPYTIDFFIRSGYRYIGGNMSYSWRALRRENIRVPHQNFNGGLSLRNRRDMLTILNTYPPSSRARVRDGSPPVDHMTIDAEDVYFTVGCIRLGLKVGDDEEAEHFALHTIFHEKFFGIHKPNSLCKQRIRNQRPEITQFPVFN